MRIAVSLGIFLFSGLIILSATLPAKAQTDGGRPDIVWMRGGSMDGVVGMDFLGNDCIVTVDRMRGWPGTIKVHRLSDGLMLRSAPARYYAQYGDSHLGGFGKVSPDGKTLAWYSGDNLLLWDTEMLTLKQGFAARPDANGSGAALPPQFSADSSLVGDGRTVSNVFDGSLFWKPFGDGGGHWTTLAPSGLTVATDGSPFGLGKLWSVGQDYEKQPQSQPLWMPSFSRKPDLLHPLKIGGIIGGGLNSANPAALVLDEYVADGTFRLLRSWDLGKLDLYFIKRTLWPNTTAFDDRYFFTLRAIEERKSEAFEAFDRITGSRHLLAGSGFTDRMNNQFATSDDSLAVSPNGKLAALGHLAIGYGEPIIQVVTVPDGKPAADLNMHTLPVTGVAYSAQSLSFATKDGKSMVSAHVIASIGLDSALFLWDARNGERLSATALPFPSLINYATQFISLSPDSRTAAVPFRNGQSGAVRAGVFLYDISDPRHPLLTDTLYGETIASRPAFSHDGQYLIYATSNDNDKTGIRLLQKKNGAWTEINYWPITSYNLGTNPICCAFDPDDKSVVISTEFLYRLSIPDLQIIRRSEDNSFYRDMALSDDGTRLVGLSGRAYLRDATTFQTIYSDVSDFPLCGVAIDPCTETFSYRRSPDRTVFSELYIRSAVDGSLLYKFNDETGLVPELGGFMGNAAAYSPDGQFLVFARPDVALVVMKNPHWTPPVTKSLAAPSPSVGGKTITATVTLECPAQIGGTKVSLTSSDPSVAYVRASVTVPVGKRTIDFAVTLAPVLSPKTVTLSAKANGVTKTTTLTVNPVNLLTVGATLARVNGNVVATVTIRNIGTTVVNNVQLTGATLGGISPVTTLPLALGSVPANDAKSVNLTFSGSVGAPGTLKTLSLKGTSEASSFSASMRVTLP